jgi:cyclohexanone monooxygenase
VDVRANGPIDPEWFSSIATSGWQQRWLENFRDNQAGGAAREDLVQDSWTDQWRRVRAKLMGVPRTELRPQSVLAVF